MSLLNKAEQFFTALNAHDLDQVVQLGLAPSS